MTSEKCTACGRTWMLGETLVLNAMSRVCPHTSDCNQPKERKRMVAAYKNRIRVNQISAHIRRFRF